MEIKYLQLLPSYWGRGSSRDGVGVGAGVGVGVGLRGAGGVKVEVRGKRSSSRSGGDIEGEEPHLLAASKHAKHAYHAVVLYLTV